MRAVRSIVLIATAAAASCGPDMPEESYSGLPPIGLSEDDERFADCVNLRSARFPEEEDYKITCTLEATADDASTIRARIYTFSSRGLQTAEPYETDLSIVRLPNAGTDQ